MAETPRLAHLVVLLFLGSGFMVAVCLIVALVGAISRAARVAKFAAVGAAACAGAYLLLLLAVAVATPDRTLPVGSWKYFCEADCHIAYSIVEVRYGATLGPEMKPLTTRGQFAVVRLRTWFDEHSIAPWRGDAPLTPDSRTVLVVDEAGRRFAPLAQAGLLGMASTPIDQPLRPGESYETTLLFDLPRGIANPKFLIADQDPVSRWLVDHENSPWHGKIYLALDALLPVTESNPQ